MRQPWHLREGWTWSPLGDLVRFRTKQVDPDSVEGDTPYIGLEHIGAGTGEVRPVTVSTGDTRSAKHSFDERAILYGKLRPYLNKVAVPDFAGLCSTDIIPIEPKPGVDRRYLAFYLRGREFVRTATLRSRGDLPRAGIRVLQDIPVPISQPSEQEHAVRMLEPIDSAVERARWARLRTADLARSAYLEIAGPRNADWSTWNALAVKDLVPSGSGAIRSGPFGSALLHSEFVDSGVAVLGIDNAVRNRFAWDELRYITPEKYEHLKRYTVLPGDVIITIMGTTGRSAVIPDDIPLAISTKHLATITPDRAQIHPEYLAAAVRYDPSVRGQVPSGRGAIMDGLNLAIIKSLVLRVPPPDVQQRLADALREVYALEDQLDDAVAASLDCLDSVSPRAFGLVPASVDPDQVARPDDTSLVE